MRYLAENAKDIDREPLQSNAIAPRALRYRSRCGNVTHPLLIDPQYLEA